MTFLRPLTSGVVTTEGAKVMNKRCELIYKHLMDAESRYLFEKRIMYYLTRDYRYISDIVEHLPQKVKLNENVEKCKTVKDHLIVWGAGNDYKILKDLYPDFDFFTFCDKDEVKQETGWDGKKVISPDDLVSKYSSFPIMINTTGFHKEMKDFLLRNGIEEEQIIDMGEITASLYDAQYFDADIMRPMDKEVFIDGGAYDLNTTRLFHEWCSGRYKKIFAFEPDKINFELCRKKLAEKPLEKLELLNKGCWNREDMLCFSATGGQGSKIIGEERGNVVRIETAAIDDIVGDSAVTFIKLDVEGAELRALEGAKECIMRYHPRLAVCLYHKLEDIIEIPAYILSLSDEYQLYIRHYQMSANETVLYAV